MRKKKPIIDPMPLLLVVEQGTILARRIKNLLYPNQKWGHLIAGEIAALLTALRVKFRIAYPDLNDLQIYKKVNAEYSNDDLIDAIEVARSKPLQVPQSLINVFAKNE